MSIESIEIQEFFRRLSCFEASDLIFFFEKVRGHKFDSGIDYYAHEKITKFTENPYGFFMALDPKRAEKFYDFIMYEWQGDWKEIYSKHLELSCRNNETYLTKEYEIVLNQCEQHIL